jgi:hypothetical protein
LSGLNRDGFLVIRSTYQGATWTSGVTYPVNAYVQTGTAPAVTCYRCILKHTADNTNTPPNATYWVQSYDRADTLTFVANGQFVNRTGAGAGVETGNPSEFTDRTVANAAIVSYGQAAIEFPTHTMMYTIPCTISGYSAAGNQENGVPINFPPSGTNDQDFILCRNTLLLMAADGGNKFKNSEISFNGINVPAFPDVSFDGGITNPMSSAATNGAVMPSGEKVPHVTSSRVAVSTLSPELLMGLIRANKGANTRYEADEYAYRYKVLTSPYQSEVGLVNGYFRMHAIALQGTPSFAVDWTDGVATGGTALTWYGMGNPNTNASLPAGTQPTPANGDVYTAIFSFDNKPYWPKAIRLRYRVTDANNRLNGGREFTQVVALNH